MMPIYSFNNKFTQDQRCRSTPQIGVVLLLATVVLSICIWGRSVAAQTRFEDPIGTVNVESYHTLYQCWALKSRLLDAWKRRDTIRRDTMPLGVSTRLIPLPRHIVESVQECTAQWDAATAPLKDWDVLAELFLVAGRKQDFSTLLSRKIVDTKKGEAIDTLLAIEREGKVIEVYNQALSLYQNAQPIHFHEIDSLVTFLNGQRDTTALQKVRKISWNLGVRSIAEAIETEPIVAMRSAVIAESLFVQLSDEDRRRADPKRFVANAMISNSAFIHFKERLDSLSISSAAYVNVVRQQLNTLFKGVDPAIDRRFEVGAKSARVDGDFWFPAKPAIPRPTPGKVSFVVPLHECRGRWFGEIAKGAWSSNRCLDLYSMLRRIHNQFPAVEITVLTYQDGRAILSEPGSAADEAEDMRRWLFEAVDLPITLAVNNADFVRLPSPDSRWVNTVWTLKSMDDWGCKYNNKLRSWSCYQGFLIDESGVILGAFMTDWATTRMRVDERKLVALLAAMSHRPQ